MNIRNELFKKALTDFNYVYSSQKEVIFFLTLQTIECEMYL